STRLSTLLVSVVGITSATRTYFGAHLVPRSGCWRRNRLKASASNGSLDSCGCKAAITWSPTSASCTAYTATSDTHGNRAMARSTGAAPKFSPSARSHSAEPPAKDAQPASRRVRCARDDDARLSRAEPVVENTAEPRGETLDVEWGGLVAGGEAQCVVGVVGLFRGGEDV